MMPKPKKFSRRTAGLHREVWEGARAYLKDERGSCDAAGASWASQGPDHSSVWIYHFEQHAEFGVRQSGRRALEEGAFRGVASELTLLGIDRPAIAIGSPGRGRRVRAAAELSSKLRTEPSPEKSYWIRCLARSSPPTDTGRDTAGTEFVRVLLQQLRMTTAGGSASRRASSPSCCQT